MSRLDYEFAPIDVSIMTHSKACAAGPEAMGMWLWGQCYARVQKTSGIVHRSSVLTAWGGKRNIMLAKRLVDSGLWILHENGDWEIHNFNAKASGHVSSSAQRMRDLRERRKSDAGDEHVQTCDANSDDLSDAQCSPSISNSLSESSLEEIKIPEAKVSAREPFAIGTAGCNAALERFEAAVATAKRGSFTLTRAKFHPDDLCRLLNAHAEGLTKLDALAWLDVTVAEWVRAAEPVFTKGYAPSKLLEWLNADRPGKFERTKSAAEVTKQGFDPEAPWMKLPETGT